MAPAAVHSKAGILLWFIHCLLLLTVFVGPLFPVFVGPLFYGVNLGARGGGHRVWGDNLIFSNIRRGEGLTF